MTPDPLWAVVPVKRFATAKMRLAGILSGDHRCRLAEAMLRDVLGAAAGCAALSGIAVVTSDEEAAALAAELGAEVVETGSELGHNAAVEAGVDHVRQRAAGVLVLAADIPLVRPEDIDHLAALHGPVPAVTIVRAVADGGTNALLVSPPDVIGFHFGSNSESRHLEAARKAGAAARSLTIARMAFDLDRPEDVGRLLDRPSPTATYRLLRRLQESRELSLQPVGERGTP